MGAGTGGDTGAGAAMHTGAGMGAGAGTGAAAAWREPEPSRADSAADAATGATAATAADAAAVWERMAGPLRHLHSAVLRRGFGRPLLSDGGPEREGEPARGRSGGGCRALDRFAEFIKLQTRVRAPPRYKRVGARRVDLYPSVVSLLRLLVVYTVL